MRPLSIQQRLKIALGTTRGIAHLHTRDPPLVHRDIKRYVVNHIHLVFYSKIWNIVWIRNVSFLRTLKCIYINIFSCSANVLLSGDLTPRIGDFGLARLGPQPQVDSKGATHLVTEEIIGTRAYMPPEAYDGEIAPRWDCYRSGSGMYTEFSFTSCD